MTVVELKKVAKEMGITGYSKMNKEQLENAVNAQKNIETAGDVLDNITLDNPFDLSQNVETEDNAKQFNMKYTVEDGHQYEAIWSRQENNGMKFGATGNQLRLLESLEDNYCITIDYSKITSRLEASKKITQITQAIDAGKVMRRDAEVAKRRIELRNKALKDNAPTDKQIAYAKKLCSELDIAYCGFETKEAASNGIKMLEDKLVRKQARRRTEQDAKPAPEPVVRFTMIDAARMYFKRLFA